MPTSAYSQLCDHVREISLLSSAESVLSWDQETYMPEKAVSFRARQMAWISSRAHELATGKMMQKLLAQAQASHLPDRKAKANVRHLAEDFQRNARIPSRLVAEESQLTVLGKNAWVEARRKADFSLFAPHLEKLVQLARRKADLWGYADEPYDALLHGYERGTRTREVAVLFEKLRPALVKQARAAVEKGKQVNPKILLGHYPVAIQQKLNAEVAQSLGFDFECGRIDTTAHPFCTTLGPCDVRLTTRYDERDFTSSLFGVMHEAGHGLYEQGLPGEDFGLPSGRACSLGIHESQSRLWENHVGRSRPFWEKWLPRAAELFPKLRKVSLDDFLAAIHRAEFSFIRVEADEATYDLHILLRFEIERRMVSGDLAVSDVPAAWNDLFQASFGMTPTNDREGCLQDIHWSMGGLGYFATYTLGNLNAAQLFSTACRQKSISQAIKKAEYAPLLEWLRKEVHAKGGACLPGEIMTQATGSTADSKHYLKHLRSRG